jgi:hypothetical protein
MLGGSDTFLYGEGLLSEMQVRFGPNEAQIVDVESDFILLRVPSSEVIGPVDVRVALGERELLLKNAFTYLRDRSDLAAGFGWVSRTDFVGVLEGDEDSSRASGYFGFLKEPLEADARRHMFPMQPGCGGLGSQPAWGFAQGVDSEMVLTGSSSDLELLLGESGLYFSPDLDPGEVLPGTAFGLRTIAHPDGREASSDTFVQLPEAFVFDDVELEGSAWSYRDRNQLDFGWKGSSGDWMVGEFSLYEIHEGGQLSELEKHHCLVEDTEGEGVFSLSQSAFLKWDSADVLVLSFHSIRSSPNGGAFRYLEDNAELRMAGRVSRIGAVRTQ